MSKLARLELEQQIREELEAERAAAQHQKEVKEAARVAEESQRQILEDRSCWCGFDHLSGIRLTEPRSHHDVEVVRCAPHPRLFISNLPFEMNESTLKQVFEDILENASVMDARGIANVFRLHRDGSGMSKGFGFMNAGRQATYVLRLLRGHILRTPNTAVRRAIRVDFAKPRTERSNRR